MACVPSNQLAEAYRSLEWGSETSRIHYGRAWELVYEPFSLTGDWELRHYGTTLLKVHGGKPVYAYMQSASDRDGINGLLRLIGIDGRYRAYFDHDLAMWEDTREGIRTEMSQVAWEEARWT